MPKYGGFSCQYVPVFRLNTGRIWTRKTSVFGHFSRSDIYKDTVNAMYQLITSDDEINKIITDRKWYQNYKNVYKCNCVNIELLSASHDD